MRFGAEPWDGNTQNSSALEALAYLPDSRFYHVFSEPIPEGKLFRPMTISLSSNYSTIDNGIPSGKNDCAHPNESHFQYSTPGILPRWEYTIELIRKQTRGGTSFTYHRIAGGMSSTTPVLHVSPADCKALILYSGERLAGRCCWETPASMWIRLHYSGILFDDSPECLEWLVGL